MAGKKSPFLPYPLFIDSANTIPEEKFRHLDPEGGYDDPEEVRTLCQNDLYVIGLPRGACCNDWTS
jgi:hypothetical protein